MEQFDFRSHAVLPDNVVRTLGAELEVPAARAGIVLGALVRRAVTVAPAPPERMHRQEVDQDASSWFRLDHGSPASRGERGVVVLSNEFVIALADVIMGGPGISSMRPPTSLELTLVSNRLTSSLAPVAEALGSYGVHQLELAPADADDVRTPPDLVRIRLELLTGDVNGSVDLLLPMSMFVTAEHRSSVAATPDPALTAALGNVPLQLAVRFEPVHLAASALEELAVGDVIRLDHAVGQPLVGEVDGRRLLLVQPGRRGRHLAVEVETVESL